MSLRIGILQPGSTFTTMIERFGDYDAWFRAFLEPGGVRCATYHLDDGKPDVSAADGWIVTGARSSICDGGQRVATLLEWIREAVAGEVPLLGVCYGHQALGAAMGAPVSKHPRGWELGTVEIELTPAGRADPLFAGFPERFDVQATHEDYVADLASDVTLLAGNDHTSIQAIAVGDTARGVQFHVEATQEILGDFVERRRDLVDIPPTVGEAPLAPRILHNFVQHFVGSDKSLAAGGD